MMSGSSPTDAQALLMLSHVLPQADGSDQRQRAWQLLTTAARTHRVYLACLVDGPAQLEHWRALQPYTAACLMEAPAAGLGFDPQAHAQRCSRSLGSALQPWLAQTRFDAVIASSPLLWPAAALVSARLSLCDLNWPRSLQHRRISREGSALQRWWHWRQFGRHDRFERQIARECDVLIVNHHDASRRYLLEPCRTIVVAPGESMHAWDLHEALQTPRQPSIALAA
jgi:hypothetical protein